MFTDLAELPTCTKMVKRLLAEEETTSTQKMIKSTDELDFTFDSTPTVGTAKKGGLGFASAEQRAEAAFLASWESVSEAVAGQLELASSSDLEACVPALAAQAAQARAQGQDEAAAAIAVTALAETLPAPSMEIC